MKSTSEVLDTRNFSSFKGLISNFEGLGAEYKPTDPALLLPNLNAILKAADKALELCTTDATTFNNAIKDRYNYFVKLRPLGTRVVNALAASENVPDNVIQGARNINRQIGGQKIYKPKPKNDPMPIDPALEEKKPNSTSQQSFIMLAEHFKALIELAASYPTFHPNEEALSPVALDNHSLTITAANDKVVTSGTTANNSQIAKDKIFYDEKTGIVAIAAKGKIYVKSAFTASDPRFKQVNKIAFRTKKK